MFKNIMIQRFNLDCMKEVMEEGAGGSWACSWLESFTFSFIFPPKKSIWAKNFLFGLSN